MVLFSPLIQEHNSENVRYIAAEREQHPSCQSRLLPTTHQHPTTVLGAGPQGRQPFPGAGGSVRDHQAPRQATHGLRVLCVTLTPPWSAWMCLWATRGLIRFPCKRLPSVLPCWFESRSGLGFSSFGLCHFLELVVGGFLRTLQFPPLLHRSIDSANENKDKKKKMLFQLCQINS